MAKTDNLTDFLTGVADAIRTKKGTIAKINPQNFESEIAGISTGIDKKLVASVTSRSVTKIPAEYFEGGDTIGESAFESCSDLTTVTISQNVYRIARDAFSWCSSLSNLYIENVTCDINVSAFYRCDKNLLFNESDGIYYIGTTNNDYARLHEIKDKTKSTYVIPEQTQSIMGSFSGCSQMTSINIPKNVSHFGLSVFVGCDALVSITVDDENQTYYSENDCIITKKTKTLIEANNSKNIIIPNNVEGIGSYSFHSRENITNIIIPDSVVTIMGYAFFACTNLQTVTIGQGVTKIYDDCFELCKSLTTITMLPTTPPKLFGSNVFPSNVTTITVPAGCGDTYKTAKNWSAYADKIVEATA